MDFSTPPLFPASMLLGAHIGISGGIEKAPETAHRLGCEVMQIFSKNQRQWRAPPLLPEVAQAFRTSKEKCAIKAVGVHASYLINLGSSDPKLQQASRGALVEELQRAEMLDAVGVILHPGAHVGSGKERGIENIVEGAQHALDATKSAKTHLILEISAGAGSTLGQTFEELAEIGHRVDSPARVGFCVDTCHVFASGIDFRSQAGYDQLMEHIGSTIGLEKVEFFHLNDALFPLGSHKDRHANIGLGQIGSSPFHRFLTDPHFRRVPGVLETPLDGDAAHPYAAYETDLKTLRDLLKSKVKA